MQLWNDYEGKTIADAYTLGPLLRPEGRTALFTLPKGVDGPSIVRLTESLNDEGQMLTCWRRVSQIGNENLLALKCFGETVFEGTPLTYAVMETPDATLAGLLAERRMTHAEAMQVASSVVPALKALHENGLVHEHIVAENVVAVGETVKLRADCVRECKIDADLVTADDCANMRQRDVEALGLLLLRALTLQKKLRPGLALPAPFDRIIANALNGMWGLTEIAAVLPAPVAPPTPMPVATQNTAASASTVVTASELPKIVAAPTSPVEMSSSVPFAASTAQENPAVVDPPLMFQRRIQTTVTERRSRGPLYAAIAIAAAILLAIFLRAFHGGSTRSAPSAPAVAQVQTAQPALRKTAAPAAAVPSQPATAIQTEAATSRSGVAGVEARLQPGWYVIAYTFNHEQQALQRAEAIVQRYPGLHPQVIAPHGRTFLIALGGAMSRDQAESLRNMARRDGMPRDTFVRNYGS